MRTDLLIVIVVALALLALVKPRLGLFGYLWFALMRPDILSWSVGVLPYSAILADATLTPVTAAVIPHSASKVYGFLRLPNGSPNGLTVQNPPCLPRS